MATSSMKNLNAPVTLASTEILYNSEYVGDAVTLDTTAFNAEDACLAGTPITKDGKVSTTADDIYGILLYDVFAWRPQATVVIGGYINTKAAQEHSEKTISSDMQAALKNVVFL
jgi:hypothetical protein